MLSNVGSGGGAAAAAAGGAAAGGGAAAPAEEAKAEEKEEGTFAPVSNLDCGRERGACGTVANKNTPYREGGVGRGYGFRSLRLDGVPGDFELFLSLCSQLNAWLRGYQHLLSRMDGGRPTLFKGVKEKATFHRKIIWKRAL